MVIILKITGDQNAVANIQKASLYVGVTHFVTQQWFVGGIQWCAILRYAYFFQLEFLVDLTGWKTHLEAMN